MFEISIKQKITHTQEQPAYRYEYSFEATDPINAKIYIVDNETHSTMLLAEENEPPQTLNPQIYMIIMNQRGIHDYTGMNILA